MDLLKIYRIYPDPGTKAVLLCRIIVQNARRFHPKIPKHLNDLPGIIIIYPSYELLEQVNGSVLLFQSCRISTAQGNNRRSERSPTEDPVLIV